MTFRTQPIPAQIAAMEARAKREREVYGQTELPDMLMAGVEAMKRVEELKAKIAAREAWDKALREFMRDLAPVVPELDLGPQVIGSAYEEKNDG